MFARTARNDNKPTGADCANCDVVISDDDLMEIVDYGEDFVRANSYGKTWFSIVVIVPTTVEIDEGNFFQTIDNAREALYALGYNYLDYDFDMYWKDSNGGSIGGSAVPGGRCQRFQYDGSISSFKRKIYPHEFKHNYGVGHAFEGPSTYGDKYDMIGGGSGASAHVSAGVKHRFKWIVDSQVKILDQASFPVGSAPVVVKINAHDDIGANVGLAADEFLAVRMDTAYMGRPCAVGKTVWCPDWATSNQSNPWYSTSPHDHYLYISYRGHHEKPEAAAGASLHVVKHREDGWVDATNFIDVRDYTDSQTDAFLRAGESYVLDNLIRIKTLSVDQARRQITVEVEYIDGAAAEADYEEKNASHLCASTVACGKRVNVDLAQSGLSIAPRSDGRRVASIKVGELHETAVAMNLCSSPGAPAVTVYGYAAFPLVPLVFGSDPLIGAAGTLPDFCADGAGYPSTMKLEGTGVAWLDGRELVFQGTETWVFTTSYSGSWQPSGYSLGPAPMFGKP